jgi:hypothetical protein
MNGVRILLKNTETKRYLGRGGTWTDKPEAALAFLDEVRAKDHSVYHRLSNTQVVVLAESDAAKAPAPTPVIVNKIPVRKEPIVKTRKNKSRITKQAETKVNRPQSMQEKLLPPQMSEITENQPASASTSTASQFVKTPDLTEQITAVQAKTDVGFGNSLFIRGQGDGLSWDKGLPLTCIDGSAWVWSTKQAKANVVFKLLLNDQVWAKGEDLVVEAGRTIEIVPVF